MPTYSSEFLAQVKQRMLANRMDPNRYDALFVRGAPRRHKHQNQYAKSLRRKAAGKPSYRQRQASARASKRSLV